MSLEKEKTYPYQNLCIEDMEGEIWKEIPQLVGYMISNLGRLKSMMRDIPHNRGSHIIKEDKILKQYITKTKKRKFNGKRAHQLCYSIRNTDNLFRGTTSRLVYKIFVQSLDEFPQKVVVSHKDKDPFNNRVENLYIRSHSELMKDNIKSGKILDIKNLPKKEIEKLYKTRSITISQYTLEGNFTASYPSIEEAARQSGIPARNIGSAIQGIYRQSGGFLWKKGTSRKKIKNKSILSLVDKTVSQYDLEGNYLCSYSSVTEAAKETGVSLSRISLCTNNKSKTAGGYIWKKGKQYLTKTL